MVWGETFQVAVQALRADKVKAMLTMLGVIIGSACIVLVVTVALTGKRYIISQIEGVGSNITYAQLTRSGKTTSLADEITLADIKAVHEQVPEIVEVAGTRDLPMTVVVEGHERPISMVGVTEGFQKIRNLEILTGRFFDPEDMTSRNKVTLLTQELADALFPKQDPLGQQVKLNDLNFTVIGIFRERVSTFGASEIQTTQVSLWPQTSSNGNTIVGYQASNSVQVNASLAKSGALVDAAVGAGANNVDGPNLDTADKSSLYGEALKKAIADAKVKAQAIADGAGLTLGALVKVQEGGNSAPPVPMFAAEKAAAAVPIEAGTQQIQASVTVTYSAS